MKRYLLFTSMALMGILILASVDSDAFCKRKKRKKQSTTKSTTAKDSVRVVHAPGVKNQKELDSIKASRVKKPN